MAGPTRFVEQVMDAIREGHSVFLALPNGVSKGLARVVRARFRGELEERLAWKDIGVGGDPRPPAARVVEELSGRANPATVTAQDMVRDDVFGGHAVWLDGIPTAAWPRWEKLLADYAHLARSIEPWARTVFLVALPEAIAAQRLTEDVTLRLARYRDASDTLDVTAFVSHRTTDSSEPSLMRQVRRAVIAEVALGDFELADAAIDWPLEELFSPGARLLAWKGRRGWGPSDVETPRWERGTTDFVDGRERVHSAILASRGDHGELERRVWRGQVAILLPHLEMVRSRLLQVLGKSLVVPWDTRNGVIEDLRDLELVHIWHQVKNKMMARNRRDHVYGAWQLRNRLAHLEPVSVEDIRRASTWDA